MTAPNMPLNGSAWIRHDAVTHSAPTITKPADCRCVGQPSRHQPTAMATSATAMTTAIVRPTTPDGPAGLPSDTSRTAAKPTSEPATTRQMLFCAPRAARNAVSQ